MRVCTDMYFFNNVRDYMWQVIAEPYSFPTSCVLFEDHDITCPNWRRWAGCEVSLPRDLSSRLLSPGILALNSLNRGTSTAANLFGCFQK